MLTTNFLNVKPNIDKLPSNILENVVYIHNTVRSNSIETFIDNNKDCVCVFNNYTFLYQ